LIRGHVAPVRGFISICPSIISGLTNSISLRAGLIATITLLIAPRADFVTVLTRSVSLLGSLIPLAALRVIGAGE
jgi:hypothetical protein